MYSNCCCSYSFEPEIIKSGQSSHIMYSNYLLNFHESTTILNTCTKKSGTLLNAPRICSPHGLSCRVGNCRLSHACKCKTLFINSGIRYAYMNIYLKISLLLQSLGERCPANEKSARFRFQLEASHVSSHTKELWYNNTLCLWMIIYIFPHCRSFLSEFKRYVYKVTFP